VNVTSEQLEHEVLERVRPSYEREGYRFVVKPRPSELPSFLGGRTPDALASRDGDNVLIEVKSPSSSAEQKALVRFLATEVRKHPGWRFDLIVAEKQLAAADVEFEPSPAELRSELARIDELIEHGNSKAALPLAWGLLEAVARRLVLDARRGEARRYMPSSVVEALVSDGYLDDKDGKRLFEIGRLRNLVVHGFARIHVRGSEVRFLSKVVRALIDEVSAEALEGESAG
jgi:hypothetical protein